MNVPPALKYLGAAIITTGCLATFMAQLPGSTSKITASNKATTQMCGIQLQDLQRVRLSTGAGGNIIPQVWSSLSAELQPEEVQQTCNVLNAMMAAQGVDQIAHQLVATDIMVEQSCRAAENNSAGFVDAARLLDVPPEELAAALCAEETDPAPSPTPSISATPSITI